MRFLFRLDLSLHAGAGIFFWNFDFCNQTRAYWIGQETPHRQSGIIQGCTVQLQANNVDCRPWRVASGHSSSPAASDRLIISVSLGVHDGVVIIGAGAAQHCGDLGHHRSRHATSVSASRVRRLRLSQAGRRGTGLSVAEEKETAANVSPALCARAKTDTRREPSTPVGPLFL